MAKKTKGHWRRGYILIVYGPGGNKFEEKKFFFKKTALKYLRIKYSHLKNREITKYYITSPVLNEGGYKIKKTRLYVMGGKK